MPGSDRPIRGRPVGPSESPDQGSTVAPYSSARCTPPARSSRVLLSSAALRSTPSSRAPLRSVSCSLVWWTVAPSSRAPDRSVWLRSLSDRSASRRSSPDRSSRVRLAPRMVTPRHCPPSTFIGRIVQPSKVLPVSLQPTNVASKKLVRRKSHAMNALVSWLLELKRQLWNVHDSKLAPLVVASVKSTSTNVTSRCCTAPSDSPYQSSPRTSDIHRAAGPPVDVVLPGQELVVDQVTPQRRVVRMEAGQDLVDVLLRIGPAELELLRQQVEYDESLRPLARDRVQPPVAGQELPRHLVVHAPTVDRPADNAHAGASVPTARLTNGSRQERRQNEAPASNRRSHSSISRARNGAPRSAKARWAAAYSALPAAVSMATGEKPRSLRSYGAARMSSTRMSRASSKQSATRSEQTIGESR